ncbi:MAG: hypothetical protein ACXAE3_11670 [Candidatus Kariarchaeaceae archaeon]|jgi:hypothetical protein
MKYALGTLLVGYVAIFAIEQYDTIVYGGMILFWLLFTFSIISKRLEAIKGPDKVRVTINSLVVTAILAGALYYLVNSGILATWLIPPLLALLVLARGILKLVINLGVKEPRSFGVMSETDKGDTVRSKGEKKVADWLYSNNIEYEYERKITLPDGSTILSDFYLRESDIFVEYWGMAGADNETGEKYRERKEEKKILYEQHGYKLMDIYPHHLYELDSYIPDQIKILTGKKRSFLGWLRFLFGNKSETKSTVSTIDPVVEPESEQVTEPEKIEKLEKLFCTNCGGEVANVGDFCVKCGTQMDG